MVRSPGPFLYRKRAIRHFGSDDHDPSVFRKAPGCFEFSVLFSDPYGIFKISMKIGLLFMFPVLFAALVIIGFDKWQPDKECCSKALELSD